MGKLVEKTVAHIMYQEIIQHDLVPFFPIQWSRTSAPAPLKLPQFLLPSPSPTLLHSYTRSANSKATLGIYVDDGVLFACGTHWSDIAETLSPQYITCVDWLIRRGLTVEPDKTELLFFRRQREEMDPPPPIHLQIPTEAVLLPRQGIH